MIIDPSEQRNWSGFIPSFKGRFKPKVTKKPVFATDLDSVIYDSDTPIRMAVQEIFGLKTIPPSPKQWDLEAAYGISPETLGPIWELVWETPFQAFKGSAEFLAALGETYRVVAVSTRKPGPARNHGIKMVEPYVQAGLIDAITWTESPQEKGYRVKQQKAVYFLDDSVHNLFATYNASPSTGLFLFDRPWNHSQDIEPLWQRVKTYKEVLQHA